MIKNTCKGLDNKEITRTLHHHSQTKKSHTMFNFFKKNTPSPSNPITDAEKLVKHIEKNRLSFLYSETDILFKENVMDGQAFTDQELYDKIYKEMWKTETKHYKIYFKIHQKPFVGVPRPELVELFKQNGFVIDVKGYDNGVVIKPISDENF